MLGDCDSSKLKVGVVGDGVLMAAESVESLRRSCGVCGERQGEEV